MYAEGMADGIMKLLRQKVAARQLAEFLLSNQAVSPTLMAMIGNTLDARDIFALKNYLKYDDDRYYHITERIVWPD